MPIRRPRLDSATAERLSTGRLGPDDAPPGFRRAAELLQAAATVPVPDAGALPAGVSAITDAIRQAGVGPVAPSPRRSPVLSKLLVGKVLAGLTAATVLSAGAAGAATGHLPAPVQDTVAKAASHVGVKLPKSAAAKGVDRYNGSECVPGADGPVRNRGQYLKQERAKGEAALAAAKLTRCGLPAQSEGAPGVEDGSETSDTPKVKKQGKSAEHRSDEAGKGDDADDAKTTGKPEKAEKTVVPGQGPKAGSDDDGKPGADASDANDAGDAGDAGDADGATTPADPADPPAGGGNAVDPPVTLEIPDGE